MATSMRQLITPLMLGTLLAAAALPRPVSAQAPGDIIVIGNSPEEWAQFQQYWNQLIQLNPPPGSTSSEGADTTFEETALDPQFEAQELKKNLRVSNLRLEFIIQLSGSSLLTGTLTNGNKEPVTIAAVNFEVLDSSGKLAQTGSAQPQPATIAPGGSVTFQKQLLTIPADGGYQVRLTQDPFVIQGGF